MHFKETINIATFSADQLSSLISLSCLNASSRKLNLFLFVIYNALNIYVAASSLAFWIEFPFQFIHPGF